jgi:hypothetical protein
MMIRPIAMLGLALLIVGCDLLNTRDPEPPDSGQGSWEIPRLPGDVLNNLSAALFERNAVDYLLSFEQEQFSFEADPEATSQDPSLEEWDFSAESAHINQLFGAGTLPPDSIVRVVFLNSQRTTLGDSAEIIADYSLVAEIALAAAPGPMAGTAYFDLRIGQQGYWEIYHWRDSRTEEQNTWSDLKSLVR